MLVEFALTHTRLTSLEPFTGMMSTHVAWLSNLGTIIPIVNGNRDGDDGCDEASKG